ncbi:GNAT family N-acetyltransferase [Aureisphaera sp. CAU 1614]|uniref:GNAT family N-acetyltransferase n=1 Tax=Halomarinibacterium sedimenti TaxID=2857106 RepID=A0A9X1FNF3_9FLAO|nr:GNAT family N-acetyltransferase [Halomarinibacterium sedimenti]MBW2937433.1 GNAT family N-acetyltransferase [Halomarinibacterium sedimenti]
MNSSQKIFLENPEWDEIVRSCYAYDFYHTRSYHKMEVSTTNHKAVLFVSSLDSNFIALPLLIREIENTSYFDGTSVYGYCGPISNLEDKKIPPLLVEKFQTEIENFFKEQNIISVFARLHPLIYQESILKGIGNTKDINQTIFINLKDTPEEQRKQYRKSNKSEINQLRGKKGYEVIRATTEKEILLFASIYNETMERVNAGDYYFFEEEYFTQLLNNSSFEAHLFLAIKDKEFTAGAIFTVTNGIMQYHLAGTKEEYSKDTPMKLIIDEARLYGHQKQLEFLHLGGGLNGSDDDSLFRFKSGFSKNTSQFRTWEYIVNEAIYKELVSKNGVSNSTFFPLYRAKRINK